MKIIDVLCTGPSLKRYKRSKNITVGVNKIVLQHRVNHLVIIDRTSGFPQFILDAVKASPYDEFHTFMPEEWVPYVSKPMHIFKLFNERSKVDLDSEAMSYSITSSFCACVLAFKLGASVIDLYGADFRDHPTFNGANKEVISRIKADFKHLQNELVKRGASLRVTSESVLAEFLPLIPECRLTQDIS